MVGIGADGWPGLSETARRVLLDAPVIAGSVRQLGLLPDPSLLTAQRLPLPSPLLPKLNALIRDNPGLCILASGDPMMRGIGATLARALGPDRLRVIPAVSSVALACARMGWPEHEVAVVSLVARPLEAILASMQPGARLVVLCRDATTPVLVAQVLANAGWGNSEVTVLEQLGGPDERLSQRRPASQLTVAALPEGGLDDLCLLAVTARTGPKTRVASRLPGLPDAVYENDGQVTRRELRAVSVSVLAPGPGQLLWDVGAGSGSISIEWVRAEPLARAIAIEARPDRAARAARNAVSLGVPAKQVVTGSGRSGPDIPLQIVTGAAPAALSGLPTPDAVFVGGGVTAAGVLEECWQRLRPGGRLVAHAVTIESEAVLVRWQQARGGQLVKIAVSYAQPLGGFTAWRPALPVTQWLAIRR